MVPCHSSRNSIASVPNTRTSKVRSPGIGAPVLAIETRVPPSQVALIESYTSTRVS